MAIIAAAPTDAARPGASGAPTRGRGRPEMVTMRRTTAIAPLIEAQALCAEVLGATERIQIAAAAGSRQLIANEAGRLGYRATVAGAEFRRMAGELEK